jgi:hypothetical protein
VLPSLYLRFGRGRRDKGVPAADRAAAT